MWWTSFARYWKNSFKTLSGVSSQKILNSSQLQYFVNILIVIILLLDFPGGSDHKNLPTSERTIGDLEFEPWIQEDLLEKGMGPPIF